MLVTIRVVHPGWTIRWEEMTELGRERGRGSGQRFWSHELIHEQQQYQKDLFSEIETN